MSIQIIKSWKWLNMTICTGTHKTRFRRWLFLCNSSYSKMMVKSLTHLKCQQSHYIKLESLVLKTWSWSLLNWSKHISFWFVSNEWIGKKERYGQFVERRKISSVCHLLQNHKFHVKENSIYLSISTWLGILCPSHLYSDWFVLHGTSLCEWIWIKGKLCLKSNVS